MTAMLKNVKELARWDLALGSMSLVALVIVAAALLSR